jgi:integrase
MRNEKGKGSVIRSGRLWYARWRISGVPVYAEQGREEKDEAEQDRLNGPPTTLTKKGKDIPTLRVFAHECNEGRYGQKIADSTLDTNESIRLNQVEPSKLGKIRVDKITFDDCQHFADSIDGSPHWVRRVCAYVSVILSMAAGKGYLKPKKRPDGTIYIHPMKGIDLPEIEERENRILAPGETEKLLNPERRIDALMLVALDTGMRKSELLRAQWGDVKQDIIEIRTTKKKGAKMTKKPVPLTAEARAVIMKQPRRSVFIFSTDSGKPLSPRNVARDFNRRKVQLGMPSETRLQDLRGTFGSLMMEAGADIKTVQTLLRHADSRTTMKMYLRSRQETQHAAVEKLRLKTGRKPVDEKEQKQA